MGSFRRPVRLAIASLLALSALAIAQETYFPKKTFADDPQSDQFKIDWYSQELKVLDEPSLFELAKKPSCESYRFLWLRTFHHPVAIRLDVRADGTGVITSKVASGTGGFRPGHLAENSSRPLLRAQTQAFLAVFNNVEFWSLPSRLNDQPGPDGSQWVIEGVKAGKYHIVDSWMPQQGPVRELGLYLAIELALLRIPKNELY
jgi:hypothetical protein